MRSVSGDEGEKLKRGCKISLGRLQYIRWVTASPTQKKKKKKRKKKKEKEEKDEEYISDQKHESWRETC
jgi:hypothetical protein